MAEVPQGDEKKVLESGWTIDLMNTLVCTMLVILEEGYRSVVHY
jgi:hypothetical protein